MRYNKKHQKFLICIFIAVLLVMVSGMKPQKQSDASVENIFSIKLKKGLSTPVSSHILGFNIVYAYESDNIWKDGNMAGYLKDVNASLLRYPGGTVSSFYHWDKPTGEGWKDSWDTVSHVIPKNKADFMDIDEYISLALKTNATPLLGINMSSGRRWNRQADGINEALALMKYCKDKKFNVKYWFLDNEPYQPDSNGGGKSIEEYAALINAYSSAMKKYDPEIKIIVNWNSAFKNRVEDYKKLLAIAGKNIDIIDVHWYWSWSNPTFSKWISKTPMEVWSGGSYISEIKFFRQMVKDCGFPGIKLASLEWNVGPIKSNQLTPEQCALMQSEMLMQFMEGGLDMATFWPLHGSGTAVAARSFVNRKGFTPHPVFDIFKFLGKFQGCNLFDYEVIRAQSNVMILVATEPVEGTIRVCFLNKNTENVRVDIETDILKKMKSAESGKFILTDMGKGSKLLSDTPLKYSGKGISFEAPSTSITMLTFKK
jgi:alpha-L-arabinofuranosidase